MANINTQSTSDKMRKFIQDEETVGFPRTQKTIQTHKSISVNANSNSLSDWFDSDGFDKIAITILNDGASSLSVDMYWSNDGINIQGYQSQVVATASVIFSSGLVDTRARYFKVKVNNLDTNSHVMNAWAYLKS